MYPHSEPSAGAFPLFEKSTCVSPGATQPEKQPLNPYDGQSSWWRCSDPRAGQSIDREENVFKAVPCRRCSACLKVRAERITARALLEASLNPTIYFVTLTHSDFTNREKQEARFKQYRKDMSRLRSSRAFIRTSEYSAKNKLIHIHLLLFTEKTFDSRVICKAWPYGISDIRLAHGTGFPLDNDLRGYVKTRNRKQRLKHDPSVERLTVVGSSSAVCRYILKYLDKDPTYETHQRGFATSVGFGSFKRWKKSFLAVAQSDTEDLYPALFYKAEGRWHAKHSPFARMVGIKATTQPPPVIHLPPPSYRSGSNTLFPVGRYPRHSNRTLAQLHSERRDRYRQSREPEVSDTQH